MEQHGIINCDLCKREFKKYHKKESTQIYGVSLQRSKTYSQVTTMVANDKSEINRHICTYCISGVLNQFGL